MILIELKKIDLFLIVDIVILYYYYIIQRLLTPHFKQMFTNKMLQLFYNTMCFINGGCACATEDL